MPAVPKTSARPVEIRSLVLRSAMYMHGFSTEALEVAEPIFSYNYYLDYYIDGWLDVVSYM